MIGGVVRIREGLPGWKCRLGSCAKRAEVGGRPCADWRGCANGGGTSGRKWAGERELIGGLCKGGGALGQGALRWGRGFCAEVGGVCLR